MKNVVVVDFAALLQRIWACVRPRTRRASYKMFTGVVCLSLPPFPLFARSLSRARALSLSLSLARSLARSPLTLSLALALTNAYYSYAGGAFGYFPSYSLGAMIATQVSFVM